MLLSPLLDQKVKVEIGWRRKQVTEWRQDLGYIGTVSPHHTIGQQKMSGRRPLRCAQQQGQQHKSGDFTTRQVQSWQKTSPGYQGQLGDHRSVEECQGPHMN